MVLRFYGSFFCFDSQSPSHMLRVVYIFANESFVIQRFHVFPYELVHKFNRAIGRFLVEFTLIGVFM